LPIGSGSIGEPKPMENGNTDGYVYECDKVTEQVPGTTGFLFTKATEKGDLKKMECPNTRAGPNSNTNESSGKPAEMYKKLEYASFIYYKSLECFLHKKRVTCSGYVRYGFAKRSSQSSQNMTRI
jgi:hypothetical protein